MKGRIPAVKISGLIVISVVVALILSAIPSSFAAAADHPILYLFWGEGCPHCVDEEEFLKILQQQYPELEMRWFETWKHPEFLALADVMREIYNEKGSGVPLTIIGNWAVSGFASPEVTGRQIEEQVIACLQKGCIDALDLVGPRQIISQIREQAANNAPVAWKLFPATAPRRQEPVPSVPPVTKTMVKIPVIGVVDAATFALPLATIIIAGLDGFNPCAMWVLSFLLTIVIHAKSRFRILLIGGIFVVVSGVIYLIYMILWFNVRELLGGAFDKVRIAIALIAILIGLINCKDFFFFKKGLSLTIPESAQPKLFKQMRQIVHTAAIPGMIAGTIVLAVTANFIELLCTAGFPVVYIEVLKLQGLTALQRYLYLIFYNMVYVIPLAVIVSVFAWKMGGRKLTEKEGRILKLVSGIMLLTLGTILLVKYELLMLG